RREILIGQKDRTQKDTRLIFLRSIFLPLQPPFYTGEKQNHPRPIIACLRLSLRTLRLSVSVLIPSKSFSMADRNKISPDGEDRGSRAVAVVYRYLHFVSANGRYLENSTSIKIRFLSFPTGPAHIAVAIPRHTLGPNIINSFVRQYQKTLAILLRIIPLHMWMIR
ncbi:MAG: hypothetical protein ACK5T6_16265, partial [Pirellula sp.]